MQLKSDPHIFSGMQRDMSISKQKPESLYDAKNLRFTARDGDTMLSITNEKGTTELSNLTMEGDYLGHCVIDNYVIVFTHGETDNIYKLIPSDNINPILTLYSGDLNFSIEHPIETLGVYENNNIQKVYWTDGYNQPRYIFTGSYPENRRTSGDDTQFDFVSTLRLEEDISIVRKEGSGIFAPGTIQYAFTYYDRYGRQSNIFHTTLLYYISYPDRGGSPEDKIYTCFQITVDNLQTEEFDYLRVYSIHRTSLNAVPTVKRIMDIELSIVSNNSTVFTDDGEIGDIVDPTELLYMGGESIIASTITQKDNTLFFGNLELKRKAIPQKLKEYLCVLDPVTLLPKQNNLAISWTEFLKEYNLKKYDSPNGYYNYINTLDWSSPGFKLREHYRLGVQFQHSSGRWSEPVFIGDYTIDGVDSNNKQIAPSVEAGNEETNVPYKIHEPCIKLTLNLTGAANVNTNSNETWKDWLINNGYKKVRPVVVFPSINDRLVLTQGMLCPTVFSLDCRKKNTPFVQSSWFLRPNICGIGENDTISGTYDDGGNIAEFRHLYKLGEGASRNGEIQGSENTDATSKHFYVDQSIVTMHSPDIEWDDSFYSLDYTNWKLKIVGAIEFTASVGTIDIQTSTPNVSNTIGFISETLGSLNRSTSAGKSLLAGTFWNDGIFKATEEDGKTVYKTYTAPFEDNQNNIIHRASLNSEVSYLVYPWHRSGSLNNDEVRGDSGTRTAVLKQKKISNFKFSDYNLYFDSDNIKNYDISPIQLFSSDQVSLLKVPFNDSKSELGNITYYGNVDTLLGGRTSFYYNYEDNNDVTVVNNLKQLAESTTITLAGTDVTITTDNTIINEGDAPVRMKYKSSKHLVFSLKADEHRHIKCLPVLHNTYNATGDIEEGNTPWISGEVINTPTYIPIDRTYYGNPNLAGADYWDNELIDIGLLVLDTKNLRLYECAEIPQSEISPGQTSAELARDYKFWSVNTQYKFYVYQGDTTTYYMGVSPFSNGNVEVIEYSGGGEPGDDIVPQNPYYVEQDTIGVASQYPYLLLGELYRPDSIDLNAFNGKTEDAIKSNFWIPAGVAKDIENITEVEFTQGDTWYTRYDCLKTYAFTKEDENQIIEIGSFLCESRINGDGRYDRNRGQISNINMSPTNFNLLNHVYSNHDNFFNYRVLDKDYYELNKFSNQITWSKEKQNAADVDLWTNTTVANTFDLDGTMGEISALRTWKDTIYCFQDKAISIISFNPRVQIPTNDGVPIEISNSYKLEGKTYISDSIGCSNKNTIAVTPSGIYFVDSNSKELYNLAGNQLTSISGSHGFSNWFKANTLTNIFYDKNRNDLYVLNSKDCIVYSELLGQFTSFMDYNDTPTMFNIGSKFYALRNKNNHTKMYSLFTGDYNYFFDEYKPYWLEFISNQDSSSDKIFSTIDMRVDFKDVSGEVIHNQFFDSVCVNNEYQNSGNVTPEVKKKFRIWRMQIPRDNVKKLDRIRNTWAKIRFTKTEDLNNVKMELHDLSVQYFI